IQGACWRLLSDSSACILRWLVAYHLSQFERSSGGPPMTFTQTCTITASRDVVWDFLLQAENVAHCLPGVEAFKQLDEDNYEGTLRVKVGPISLALQGTLHVEARDREQWHGAMRADAKDRRLGGGVRAHLSM